MPARRGRVYFDRGPSQVGAAFVNPSAIIKADGPGDVERAFDAIQCAQADGRWLAGYVSYELGYLTSNKLSHLLPAQRVLPLIHFGVFDQPAPLPVIDDDGDVILGHPQPHWDFATYKKAFQIVHDYISAGDIYQANLTFPLALQHRGSLEALYARLRQHQPVPHGALVDLGGLPSFPAHPSCFFHLRQMAR